MLRGTISSCNPIHKSSEHIVPCYCYCCIFNHSAFYKISFSLLWLHQKTPLAKRLRRTRPLALVSPFQNFFKLVSTCTLHKSTYTLPCCCGKCDLSTHTIPCCCGKCDLSTHYTLLLWLMWFINTLCCCGYCGLAIRVSLLVEGQLQPLDSSCIHRFPQTKHQRNKILSKSAE